MVSSILRAGDKIDIRIMQQVDQMEKTGEDPHIYKSIVYDVKENGDLEIGMPTENGKMVLLALGIRYELVIYARGGLYRCIGQIKERYKRDNLYMLSLELKTALSKYQRREFYRLECLMDISFLPLTEEEAKMADPVEMEKHHKKEFPDETMRLGIAVDISGGGIRFVTEEDMEKNGYVLVRLKLQNSHLNREYLLPGRILQTNKVHSQLKKKEYRVQFIMKNPRIREQIIKYIFEEDRKNRKNG